MGIKGKESVLTLVLVKLFCGGKTKKSLLSIKTKVTFLFGDREGARTLDLQRDRLAF